MNPMPKVIASRVWTNTVFYVANLPEKQPNGRYNDWGYTNKREQALALDWKWAKRFVGDCVYVGAEVKLEPLDAHSEPEER